MAKWYTTQDGDVLDAICYRHYGSSRGTVEAVLLHNPHLSELGVQYRAGTRILLPDLPKPSDQTYQPVRLWD